MEEVHQNEEPLIIERRQEGDEDDDRNNNNNSFESGENDWKKKSGIFIEEVKKQVWLAGPLVSVNIMLFSLQLISIMFVGHLGELPLSGASMATSFATVTGFSLLMGMSSALDTFCGQSYGAKQYHMLGIHLQRAMIVLLVVSIPLAIIWANARYLLELVGQDHQIAVQAGQYAQFLIPGLFAYGLLYSLLRFLQAQNIVFPMMISTLITTLLHLLLCWILVFKCGLGHRGGALSTGFAYWINVILLALYVKFSSSCSNTWTEFSPEVLHDLFTFIKLSVPSTCMACLIMWSFELTVLLGGLLPNPKLETFALFISLNTTNTVSMIPFGLGGTVSGQLRALCGIARGCGWQKIGAIINLRDYYIVGILSVILLAFVLKFGGMAKKAIARVYKEVIPNESI